MRRKLTKNGAEKWEITICKLYRGDEDAYCTTFNRIVVVLDMKQEKMRIARCRQEDVFSEATGLAIAYARLRGLPVHPEYASKTDKILVRDN